MGVGDWFGLDGILLCRTTTITHLYQEKQFKDLIAKQKLSQILSKALKVTSLKIWFLDALASLDVALVCMSVCMSVCVIFENMLA